jgi:hypothetical protein
MFSHILKPHYLTATAGKLTGFFMQGMGMTELAVLFQLNPVGVIFLIRCGSIIPTLAFRAGQSNTNPHRGHLLK